jgi:hypothetical protein
MLVSAGSHSLQRLDHLGNRLSHLLIGLDHRAEIGTFVFVIELFEGGHLFVAFVVSVQEGSESLVGLPENSSGRKSSIKEMD